MTLYDTLKAAHRLRAPSPTLVHVGPGMGHVPPERRDGPTLSHRPSSLRQARTQAHVELHACASTGESSPGCGIQVVSPLQHKHAWRQAQQHVSHVCIARGADGGLTCRQRGIEGGHG